VPTYFQILTAIISFAMANPKAFARIWDLIMDTYQATLDMIDGIKDELPDVSPATDGTLALTNVTPDEMDAEERLEAIIAPNSQSLKLGGGNLRKVITWLQSSEIGRALLTKLLSSMGS
jgi:hypothetical protein